MLYRAGFVYVEIFIVVCTCWISRCTLERTSQQPVMMETWFKFLNTLPVRNEYIRSIRIYLLEKSCFIRFWTSSHPNPDKYHLNRVSIWNTESWQFLTRSNALCWYKQYMHTLYKLVSNEMVGTSLSMMLLYIEGTQDRMQ